MPIYGKKKLRRRVTFSDLIWGQMGITGLSLRQAALRAQLSPSFLSRILSGERGLPSNESLLRLAEALEIEPPEELLVAAGRIPKNRPEMVPLFRAAGGLTADELQTLIDIAERLAKKRENKET